MRKRLTLHIGMGKTGTTALQNFFWENRCLLMARGIHYPELGLKFRAHHLLSPHVPNYIAGRQDWDFMSPEEWAVKLTDSPAERVLISSEFFFAANFGEIERLRDALRDSFDTNVIVYLRRQEELVTASYNQRVKSGHEVRPVDIAIQGMLANIDYTKRLEPWALMFGQENIIVRPYEHCQFWGGDIRQDFLFYAFDIEEGRELEFHSGDPNPRFPVALLDYKRHLNAVVTDRQQHKRCLKLLESYIDEFHDEVHLAGEALLEGRSEALVRERFSESNALVAKCFMARGQDDLFRQKTLTGDAHFLAHRAIKFSTISSFLYTNDPELGEQLVQQAKRVSDEGDPLYKACAKKLHWSFLPARLKNWLEALKNY